MTLYDTDQVDPVHFILRLKPQPLIDPMSVSGRCGQTAQTTFGGGKRIGQRAFDPKEAFTRASTKEYCNVGVVVRELGSGKVMLAQTCPLELKAFVNPLKPERFNAIPISRSCIMSLKDAPNSGSHIFVCVPGAISVFKMAMCYPELFGSLDGLSTESLHLQTYFGQDRPDWKWYIASSHMVSKKPAGVFGLVQLLYIHVLYYKRNGKNFFQGRHVNCLTLDRKMVTVNFFAGGVVTVTPYCSSDCAPYVAGSSLSWH